MCIKIDLTAFIQFKSFKYGKMCLEVMGSNFKKTDVIPIAMKLKLHPTARITLQSSLSFFYGQGVIFGVVRKV